MRTEKPAVALKGKGLVFARTELAAEIEYRAWTSDGKLRHASFKGLRETEDGVEVYEVA